MKLSEIRDEQTLHAELLKELENAEEFTDEHEQKLQLILECQETSQEAEAAKIEGIIQLIKLLDGYSRIRKEESDRLKALAIADANKAASLRELLMFHLQSKKVQRFRTPLYNLTVAKNGGKQAVRLRDGVSPLDLPKQFQKVSVESNNEALREYLSTGGDLPFAYLEERGHHLLIK
jgi:hypothetical protein